MSKPLILAYVRISTDRQENSKDAQHDRIRDYAARRELGDPIFFCDSAVSGKTRLVKRPAGGAMWPRIRRGDHLVLTKIDRAFRSTADCALKVIQINQMGVRLHILDFGGDLVDCVMPVARNVWQQVEAGSPAAFTRRLIIWKTSVRCGRVMPIVRWRVIARNRGVWV